MGVVSLSPTATSAVIQLFQSQQQSPPLLRGSGGVFSISTRYNDLPSQRCNRVKKAAGVTVVGKPAATRLGFLMKTTNEEPRWENISRGEKERLAKKSRKVLLSNVFLSRNPTCPYLKTREWEEMAKVLACVPI